MKKRVKAIGLLSGGLDSTLALKLMIEQGIEVVAFNLKTIFCTCDHGSNGCVSFSRKFAAEFGVQLKSMGAGSEYIELVKKPKFGRGSHMNPCIDCRIFLLIKARELMNELDAQFIFTGEVLGQRPMSQHRKALLLIEKEAGVEGLILRPLSAHYLPLTVPELRGWVDRSLLLAFQGRTRRPQMDLAAKYGITDYPCPAGGCLLTDPGFAARLRDLFDHGISAMNDILLLKLGRHFRLAPATKLIVGRNERENHTIANLVQSEDILLEVEDVGSPLVLMRGQDHQDLLALATSICKRYSDAREAATARVKIWQAGSASASYVTAQNPDEKYLRSLLITE